MKYLKFFFFAAVISTLVLACVDDDDFDVPQVICEQELMANGTIASVFNLATDQATLLSGTDIIFDGYVVSTDEYGNFFSSISIQDAPENPTAGIQIELDANDLYTFFPIGSRVLVKADGLYLARDRGVIKMGGTFESNGEIRIGRLPEPFVFDQVFASCDEVATIAPKEYNSIAEALKPQNINTLVRINGVQFEEADGTLAFYDPANDSGGATNHVLTDALGNRVDVRTSEFADFSSMALPQGSGSIVAVVGAFDSNGSLTASDYQLTMRNIDDLMFDEDRFVPITGAGFTGGRFADYFSCYNEGFEDFETNQTSFDFYENLAFSGERFWRVRSFSGNRYLEFSAFSSEEENDAYFIVPVDFDRSDVFSFKTQDRFYDDAQLRVYYSTDYTLGTNPASSTLVEITDQFTISSGNTGSTTNPFVESGDFDLSSLSGQGAIFFRYTGDGSSGDADGTYHVDDIRIEDLDGTCEFPAINALFFEDFETQVDGADINLTDWVNVDENGNTPIWQADEFGGNTYAVANAFNIPNPVNIWLVTPAINLDASENETLEFTYQQSFYTGDQLQVLISTDYDGTSTNPQDFTWTDLTAQADLSENNPNGFMSGFASSGAIDISSFSGDVYIAFVYMGNNDAGATTRVHIDDILVVED